ncbi:BAG family molecular chaperone regulator 1-like [Branchiostoma lanceolatum]|uniref:BAG family molecular chaperone regulator 1 n=1 Tax=Branchiostoma lanceolatum TaxID=7740 RepID=A0A8J9YPQ4_BRALA|nr:BAG1 [Branchiostoma lanceolatum]
MAASMKLLIVHGSQKHNIDVCVPEDEGNQALRVEHLALAAWKTTGVPVQNQRLIYKGKSLKDPEKTLQEMGLKDGAKVMMIGKKHNPEEEAELKSLEEVDKAQEAVEKKLTGMSEELEGMEKGFLEESLMTESLPKLEKRLGLSTEELMKMLERLDSTIIHESHIDAKKKRKSVVQRIQVLLDRCDNLLTRTRQVKTKSTL